MRYAVLVLLFGLACVQTTPLKVKGHFEFEDALAEKKGAIFGVWGSEAADLKTPRVVDPVGTTAIQSPAESSCDSLIRGAGTVYGKWGVIGNITTLVRFNTTQQDESLIITGVRLYCGEHLMAMQMQYNNTWGPKYGEWLPNCVHLVTQNHTFEFDSTEWMNRVDVSVIGGFPWALTLHTNKRQLPTCGVPTTHPNCERGERLLGIAGYSGCWFDRLQFIWSENVLHNVGSLKYTNSYILILLIFNCCMYL